MYAFIIYLFGTIVNLYLFSNLLGGACALVLSVVIIIASILSIIIMLKLIKKKMIIDILVNAFGEITKLFRESKW